MERKKIKKQLLEFDNSIKTEGICCVNSSKGDVVHRYGMTEDSEKLVDLLLSNGEFEGLNSQFNSIFYDRGFPHLISIKNKNQSRFIKFLDKDHFVYAIVSNGSLNYAKIKSRLDKIIAD